MTPAEMGRKGGSKTGASKRRGDSAYYRALAARRTPKHECVMPGCIVCASWFRANQYKTKEI